MKQRTPRNVQAIGTRALLFVGCIAGSQWLVYAQAAAQVQPEAGAATARQHATRHVAAQSIEDRVKTLSRSLELDAKQQSELRKVLEDQREQVKRLWADATVSTAYRIGQTQAIGERTADQIRGLLNDEQKKKYNPPRQPHEAQGSSPSVEDWMNKARPQ